MAVNTPSGLSQRQVIKNSVLQGETWGSILASVQVDTIGKECDMSGYGYMYKDSLQVSMLGLVDDIIGVTEAGYKAQQLNALINVKTADKCLQFGVKKCKSMLIGKEVETILHSALTVDKWAVSYIDIPEVGEDQLKETFEGQVQIEQTDQQKYLGFVLSRTGDNMVNINHIKKKSKGIRRRIFNRLNSLTLNHYYFECALVMMNAMLRSSILYACETYYDLKEQEIRNLERIEEEFLRELLKTTKGCPITQIYLEVGLIPARFEIIRIRLLFLKNILNQSEESMIVKFFKLQIESPVKGDWAATCLENLNYLQIEESLEEIKEMSDHKYKRILKERIKKAAYEYLTGKQRSKGGDIYYSDIQMAEYLLPVCRLTNEVKRDIFAMRNGMTNIPANFSSQKIKFKCIGCQSDENMKHIYICKELNSEKPESEYENVYTNDVMKIHTVYKRFDDNMKKRENLIKELENEEKLVSHVIQTRDPLYRILYSNG